MASGGSGKYVPPALRRAAAAGVGTDKKENNANNNNNNNAADVKNRNWETGKGDTLPPSWGKLYSLNKIAAHFGYPVHDDTLVGGMLQRVERGENQERAGEEGEGKQEIGDPATAAMTTTTTTVPDDVNRYRGTLNAACGDEPGELAYIVIFSKSHPFWKSKGEIFCKSNLDLIPSSAAHVELHSNDDNKSEKIKDKGKPKAKDGYDDITTPSPTSPSYPIFLQVRLHRDNNGRCMLFSGYFQIENVRYLEPGTTELIEYLESKFGKRPRGIDAWKKSLTQRWVVITMRRDEGRKDEVLEIKQDEEIVPQRSVNEMLAELRFG